MGVLSNIDVLNYMTYDTEINKNNKSLFCSFAINGEDLAKEIFKNIQGAKGY